MTARRRGAIAWAALALCLGAAAAAPDDEGGDEPVPAETSGDAAEATDASDATGLEGLSEEERAAALRKALEDLSERLGGVKRLRARFVQRKYLAVFEREVVSSGSLALAPPDRLRWEYEEPIESVLVVNGDRARTTRTSRRGEVSVRAFSLAEDRITAITAEQVFLWTRGDFTRASAGYDLALDSLTPLTIRATPKDERMRKVVRSVALTFTADRKALAEVRLDESETAQTRIAFEEIEIDPELPDRLFRVTD